MPKKTGLRVLQLRGLFWNVALVERLLPVPVSVVPSSPREQLGVLCYRLLPVRDTSQDHQPEVGLRLVLVPDEPVSELGLLSGGLRLVFFHLRLPHVVIGAVGALVIPVERDAVVQDRKSVV